jgi:phage-related protein
VANIAIKIFADVQSLKKSLAGADDELQSFRDKVSASGKKMVAAGSAMTAGLTVPILAMGKSFVDAGVDMAETASKVQTLFGDQADEINAWADTSAKSFGQSKKAALDAAGTFGNMFLQLGIGRREAAEMSKSITELASDFASFHNTSPEEAIQAIGAAFRGEFDSVQKYVPTITAAAVEHKALEMGLKRSTRELTAQDKALATQAILFEDAGDAVGDFDRTASGAANTQRTLGAEFANLRAELGEKLLPVYQRLQEMVRGLIDWFSGLTDGQQKLILAFGGVIAVAGPLIVMMGALAIAVAAVSWPVLAVIAGIAALTAGVIYAYREWDWFHDAVNATGRFIRDRLIPALKDLWAWFQEHIAPAVEKVATFTRDKLLTAWDAFYQFQVTYVIPAVKELWHWFENELLPVLRVLWDWTSRLGRVLGDVLGAAFRALGDDIGTVINAFRTLWQWSEPAREAGMRMASAFGDHMSDSFRRLGAVVGTVVDAIRSVVSWADRAIDKVRSLTDRTRSMLGGGSLPGTLVGGITGLLPGRAMGGPVSAGSPYMVGEVGPELFVPRTSGTIVPNHALGGGGNSYYTINVNGGDPQQVVAALRQYTRDNGASWMTSVA